MKNNKKQRSKQTRKGIHIKIQFEKAIKEGKLWFVGPGNVIRKLDISHTVVCWYGIGVYFKALGGFIIIQPKNLLSKPEAILKILKCSPKA